MTDDCCGCDSPNLDTLTLKDTEHTFIQGKLHWNLLPSELLIDRLSVHCPDPGLRARHLVQRVRELPADARVKIQAALVRRLGRTRLGLPGKHIPVDPLLDRRKYQDMQILIKGRDRLLDRPLVKIRTVLEPDDALARLDEPGKVRLVWDERNVQVDPLNHTVHVNIHHCVECRRADGLVLRDGTDMDHRHYKYYVGSF